MSKRRSDEIIEKAEYVTIGELVRLTGMRYSTIKYYSEIGFVPYVQIDQGLTRRYNRKIAMEILEKIKVMRESGVSIEQIRKELDFDIL